MTNIVHPLLLNIGRFPCLHSTHRMEDFETIMSNLASPRFLSHTSRLSARRTRLRGIREEKGIDGVGVFLGDGEPVDS
jgi:hypothetical protein